MFKVVPDQLRISDGWVRCGQCDEVFDANAHLHTATDAQPAPEPEPREAAAPTSPDPDWAASLRFESDESAASEKVATEPLDAETPLPESWSSAPAQPVDNDPALDDFLAQSPGALAGGAEADTPPLESDNKSDLDALGSPAPRYTQATPSPTVGEPKLSFMPKGDGLAFWDRTLVKWGLAGIAGVLVLALGLQYAYVERDRIAAYQPEAVPALEVLCEWAGCQLAPLQSIEAVVIDSSSFTKLRSDVYRLNVAIKNTGTVPVLPPSLELTLTDMQDQSMVRKVLAPRDIGWMASTLEPGAEFTASLPIAVKPASPTERVSGYRLLAFYP